MTQVDFASTTLWAGILNKPSATTAGQTLVWSTTANDWVAGPVGISAVVATAALTPTGSQGSLTFVNGILTAQTPAT